MSPYSYKDLLGYIRALAGVQKFTRDEESALESIVNQRMREAYLASNGWPRYLRVGVRSPVKREDGAPYAQIPVGTMPLIVSKGHPFRRLSTYCYEFYVEADRLFPIGADGQLSEVFVTMKLPLETVSSGADSEIPPEFFRFVGHASYADFLRMDGQTDKALAEEGVLGGFELGREYDGLDDTLLVCATETKTDADLDAYAEALAKVL